MAATGEIKDRAESTTASFDSNLASATMRETAGLKPGQTMTEDEQEGGGKDEEQVATLIRAGDNDFRGFLGDLEREIKPWRDPSLPHIHTAGTELLPWFRLATLGNPQNERAYLIGTWWLKTLQTKVQLEEGLRFIDEGIKNNEKSFGLHLMRGYILRELDRKLEAKESFVAAANLVFLERPKDGSITRDWPVSREEMAVAAWNMAAFSKRDFESVQSAADFTRGLIQQAPDARPLGRTLRVLEAELANLQSQPAVSSGDSVTTSP
jgi:hypothetical protein